MPLLLIFALAGSVAIHAAALFSTDIELLGSDPEPRPLLAELRPPPPAPSRPAPQAAKTAQPAAPVPPEPPPPVEPALRDESPIAASEPPAPPPEPVEPEEPAAPAPVVPLLPASGAIRFAIYKESLGLQIGRAEHRWEFTADGHYHLTNVTETSGLAALFKPVRMEVESRGRLVAGGLQPERYHTRKNGRDNRESADFDWTTGQVHLARNDSVLPIEPGAQDLLSLTYQLAYLKNPEAGSRIGVVTARKYQHYPLDSLGEETIDIPAGHFRTLHLRAATDTVTEIWMALDLHRLPVKIRYTDKKGDSFIQVATEIGMQEKPARP